MKKIFTVVFSALLVFVLAACGNTDKNNGTSSTYDKVKKDGVITFGTEGTYAPFTYRDKSGKLTGFDVEIATEVAKRMGVKAKFVETKWAGMFAGLDSKRYDAVANEIGIQPERQEKYAFSDPYITSRSVVITKKGSNTGISSLADLKGKKVAQSLGSNYRKIAEENGAQITTVEGFNQAVDLITSKRVDATVNDSLSFLTLKKTRPDLPLETVYEDKKGANSALLFRKNDTKLVKEVNSALKAMKKDGTYLKISKKWFGTDVSK